MENEVRDDQLLLTVCVWERGNKRNFGGSEWETPVAAWLFDLASNSLGKCFEEVAGDRYDPN